MFKTELSIQDFIPPVSLFASSLDDISFFSPVSFLDLLKHYDMLLPPTIVREKPESEHEVKFIPANVPRLSNALTGTTLTANKLWL